VPLPFRAFQRLPSAKILGLDVSKSLHRALPLEGLIPNRAAPKDFKIEMPIRHLVRNVRAVSGSCGKNVPEVCRTG
jgi:hypothetical protein